MATGAALRSVLGCFAWISCWVLLHKNHAPAPVPVQIIPPNAKMEFDIELISFSDHSEGQSQFMAWVGGEE